MAFVPNQDGTEVTVLFLNVPHEYQISDGSSLAHHKPLLITRAGSCSGDCTTRDSEIAQFLYEDMSASEALDALEGATTTNGSVWALSGSDLSIHKGNENAAALPALVMRNNVR